MRQPSTKEAPGLAVLEQALEWQPWLWLWRPQRLLQELEEVELVVKNYEIGT